MPHSPIKQIPLTLSPPAEVTFADATARSASQTGESISRPGRLRANLQIIPLSSPDRIGGNRPKRRRSLHTGRVDSGIGDSTR